MITDQQIKLILKDILPIKELDKLSHKAKKNGKKYLNYLIEKKVINSTSFYEKAAQFFNIPFINLKEQTIRKDILMSIPEPIATTHKIIAFDSDKNNLKIATLDPQDLETFEFIKKKAGRNVEIHLTTPESIEEVLICMV